MFDSFCAPLYRRVVATCCGHFRASSVCTHQTLRSFFVCDIIIILFSSRWPPFVLAARLPQNRVHRWSMHCLQAQRTIASPGRGLLAMDESNATVGKRLDSIGLENNETNRKAYREMLVSTKVRRGAEAAGGPSQG